ncbi:hypothetical protein [Orlajensenia leifsoniae]|uniref:Uncharacterized protein n=1 Tax=Orlajensenia leifsoniae TaxID=2561933 RepID=A0A4Y9R336_9MICO|nr:hypothetical protein [Leifsonia flava]TFV98342.1 hypothetical protein E4M00_10090 [Leifsonia flava]
MTDADNDRDDVQQGQASNAADAADNARNQAGKSGGHAPDTDGTTTGADTGGGEDVDVHGEPENPAG